MRPSPPGYGTVGLAFVGALVAMVVIVYVGIAAGSFFWTFLVAMGAFFATLFGMGEMFRRQWRAARKGYERKFKEQYPGCEVLFDQNLEKGVGILGDQSTLLVINGDDAKRMPYDKLASCEVIADDVTMTRSEKSISPVRGVVGGIVGGGVGAVMGAVSGDETTSTSGITRLALKLKFDDWEIPAHTVVIYDFGRNQYSPEMGQEEYKTVIEDVDRWQARFDLLIRKAEREVI